MKLHILSPDAAGNIDPTIYQTLLEFLPNRVQTMAEADAVIVPVAYRGDYHFNPSLNGINKPIILMDYLEFGWDAGEKENRLGYGALRQFGHLASGEWAKLDDFVRDHPPRLTFKRELLARDHVERMLPVEWPCRLPLPPLQSKAEFDARPLEVFASWGYSHPSRPRLHGKIFEAMADNGIHVLDAWDQEGHFEGRTWATIHSPHYNRKPIEEVMRWQQQSKISVSLPGAGIKCFRSAEAPVGAIMALSKDNLVWWYDWVDGFNCIRLDPDNLLSSLECATHWDSLYSIYAESQKTIEQYRSPGYVRCYICSAIETVL